MASLIQSIHNLSIRYKLLALVLGPLLCLALTVILSTAYFAYSLTYQQLIAKVNTDLRVTEDLFKRIQRDRQVALGSFAGSSILQTQLEANNTSEVLKLLRQKKIDSGFDFLNLLKDGGHQRFGENGWSDWDFTESPLTDSIFKVAKGGQRTAKGIEIYSEKRWSQENPAFAEKILLDLVDTPRAEPTNKTVENRAMVVRVLQFVETNDGQVLGVLEGGVLLNRNHAFVDEIRDLVYVEDSMQAGSFGTVTVLLDDIRIATNLPGFESERAVGTRASAQAYRQTIRDGMPWNSRSFIINNWYISACKPIVDVFGNRVGILHAGYLETPFRNHLYKGLALIALVIFVGCLLAGFASVVFAKSIYKPIEAVTKVVRATADGKRQRIGNLKANNEIGEMAEQFDSMLDTLEENRTHIEANAQELEQKVQTRTTELKRKNSVLQESIALLNETQAKLATAEKLAAIGQLTAGVAHEINNPTAVILGNMDVLIQELGNKSDGVKTEIDLIIEQVYRIRAITDRLLQYSRPEVDEGLVDYSSFELPKLAVNSLDDLSALFPVKTDVNELIELTPVMVKHELARKNISLKLDLGKVPVIKIDKQELQQVLVNLLLNAIHAVEIGGIIKVLTSTTANNELCIEVRDNGRGIAAAQLNKLFDPFYTFGKEGGVGLGLSVSYGIVKRYNGHIDVESTLGAGSKFKLIFATEKQAVSA